MSTSPLFPQPQPSIMPIEWPGIARRYTMQLDQIGTVYRPIPGVYIFCRAAVNNRWDAIYVGETENFQRRLTEQIALHHRWECVRRAGATHISTLHVPGAEALRLAIETDLRNCLNPPCNRQ